MPDLDLVFPQSSTSAEPVRDTLLRQPSASATTTTSLSLSLSLSLSQYGLPYATRDVYPRRHLCRGYHNSRAHLPGRGPVDARSQYRRPRATSRHHYSLTPAAMAELHQWNSRLETRTRPSKLACSRTYTCSHARTRSTAQGSKNPGPRQL